MGAAKSGEAGRFGMATGRDYRREVISSVECWFCVLYRLSGMELRSGSAEISAAQEVGSAAILDVFASAEFFGLTRYFLEIS